MKILYHHRTASADGQAVHIEELIGALRERGHEVRIVGPALDSEADPTHGLSWVGRLKAHLPKALYELLELAYSAVAYWRLAREAARFQPDFIYERYNLFMVAGVLIAKRYRLPLILEVNSPLALERGQHGGLGLPGLARWVEGWVWRSADRVLPVTRVLAGYVEEYGVPAGRVAVIPNGVNEAHFAAAPPADAAKEALGLAGRLVLGFTGFVRDWHGVDKVIRWMADSRSPAHAQLLVVGDGPARGDLERLALELRIAERVTFTGVVPRGRLPRYVAAFDIALQPAVVAYASPLKLFEYLALGKAILAPQTPNLGEVLEHGRNSLLFAAEQPGALEDALDRLCGDAGLRARLGQAARDTIHEGRYTWLGNAEKIESLAALAVRP